jgi:MFS family permease
MDKVPRPIVRSRWATELIRSSVLRYRDFRFLWLSALLTQLAVAGELVTLSWLVLQRTDSPLMVGLALGVRMAPQFFVGVPAGSVVDRFDRRLLMRLLIFSLALVTGLLGLLLLLNVAAFWHILALVFVTGGLRVLHQAARQSFAYDIVGKEQAIRGLAMITLAQRLGMLGGSLLAGFVLQNFGPDAAFLILAIIYSIAGLFLLPIKWPGQAAPEKSASLASNILEHLREFQRNRTLLTLAVLASATELLGFSHQVLLPSIARDVLGLDASGFGLLHAFRSVGGVLGILVIYALSETRRKGLLLLGVLTIFGLAVMSLGWAQTFIVVVLIVIVINVMSTMTDVLNQSLMQLSVPNQMRGRAMGSWALALGTAPVGQVQVGALASFAGISAALVANGLGLVMLAGLSALFVKKLRRL